MTAYTTAQQKAIACLDRPLQIIACAGSGKTQVISQRIVSILRQPGIEPRHVVAFTFTEKAAAELKERVLGLVDESGLSSVGMAEMYIGTMHGFCLDLLQRHVPETFKFSVLTEITSRLLVDRNSRRSGLTQCPLLAGGTLRRWTDSKLYLSVLGILREDDVDEESIPEGVEAAHLAYLDLLREKNYFDYTSMILVAVQLLEELASPDADPLAQALLGRVRDQLKYVVVDEYQDVNPLQERLIRGLTQFGANLCVVGDDDQTIYQWRGSEVANIITFASRVDGVSQVTMAENFRSSEGVIDVGRSVAELIAPGDRLPKRMIAAGHQKWAQEDLLALEFPDEAAEVAWICDRIETLRGIPFVDKPGADPRGLSWSDCAVLFRSVAGDAGALVDEMRRREIPFVIKGLNQLFEAPEIRAVVDAFRYVLGQVPAEDLRSAWSGADLLPVGAHWPAALAVLDQAGDFTRGARWGQYNIQRVYLDLLEALGLREDTIPGPAERAELVLYQLGKFSQVISDFEEIHFSSAPASKYQEFLNWLQFQAPGYYADSEADVGYAMPDAVTISTVHQAKGMEWPAVFIPCLRRNRFPAARVGGRNVFHVIPNEAVPGALRYRGSRDDEIRLFYVALTRAQKYLAITFSPGGTPRYRRRSDFFDHCTRQWRFLTRDPGLPSDLQRLSPTPKVEVPRVTLSFSELKYFFECPYQFKMRFLYGFNAPLHEALGFGKGLHDALAEVHKRAIEGDLLTKQAAKDLVDRHLSTPYAYPELRRQLERAAIEAIERYFDTHGASIPLTIHSELPVQVHLGDGIVVDGRVDLIRHLDSDQVSIVDFKSSERAQENEVTRDQLHTYVLGYEELTGKRADRIEVLNLDPQGKNVHELVDDQLVKAVKDKVLKAGAALRANDLHPHDRWCRSCETCDFARMCPTGQRNRSRA